MNIEFYCDLYVSECWKAKRGKILNKLMKNRLQPQVYIVALSQGSQNHLEFFSSVLFRQRIFEEQKLFITAVVFGYEEALSYVLSLTREVYEHTGSADIRAYILNRQSENKKAGQNR